MSDVKTLFKELFPTTDPGEAARGKTGELEAKGPPAPERSSGDWVPIIAVGVGIALLALAFLRQPGNDLDDLRRFQEAQSSERPLPEEERGY
jgi:hypothetical protein